MAGHRSAVGEMNGGDIAGLAIHIEVRHLAFDTLYTQFGRYIPQIAGVECRIEVIRMVIARVLRIARGEIVVFRDRVRNRIFIDLTIVARLPQSQPVMVGRNPFDRVAIVAECVEMPVSRNAPVAEFDAQLERTLGAADEIEFIDAEQGVALRQQRDRRLPDTDDADFLRFNQSDARPIAIGLLGQQRGCDPPRGTAAQNDDFLPRTAIHRKASPGTSPVRLPNGAGPLRRWMSIEAHVNRLAPPTRDPA